MKAEANIFHADERWRETMLNALTNHREDPETHRVSRHFTAGKTTPSRRISLIRDGSRFHWFTGAHG